MDARAARIATAAAAVAAAALALPAPATAAGPGLLPDLQTVVPHHLNLVNTQKRELLRFSNSVANLGAGDWRMRPVFPGASDPSQTQDAVQEILDADRNVVYEAVVSETFYHPTHNHWHMDDIGIFEIRRPDPVAPELPDMSPAGLVGGTSVKTTFCLIDWVKIDDNSPTTERVYFDCAGSYQGVSPGWTDQYHQATDGQEVEITGLAPGTYYLVSTSNNDGVYIETDTSNNTAWTRFTLSRDSKGNPKVAETGHSPCTGGMCGNSANR